MARSDAGRTVLAALRARSGLLMVALGALLLFACLKEQPRNPPEDLSRWYVHTVQPGEFLGRIAFRFGVGVPELIAANQLNDTNVVVGQRLIIPGVITPPVAPPPVAGVVPSWFKPRSQWTSTVIHTTDTVPMEAPYRITVHHSGEPRPTTLATASYLPLIEKQHMGAPNFWACIGYHFIIDRDGTVWEGRPLTLQGAHAGNPELNRGNIGICLLGNFDLNPVPAAQLNALNQTIERLRLKFPIKRTQVWGHTEIRPNPTNCPGRLLAPWVRAYRTGT